jgi:hypothetical protein
LMKKESEISEAYSLMVPFPACFVRWISLAGYQSRENVNTIKDQYHNWHLEIQAFRPTLRPIHDLQIVPRLPK